MAKKVLSVGQCRPDHAAIVRLIEGGFDAEVVAADLPDDAFETLDSERFDLVLINRKLDADYSDGIEILRRIKTHAEHGTVPAMLITNFEEHQRAAVEEGAEPGFGKLEYHNPETIEKLSRVLGPPKP